MIGRSIAAFVVLAAAPFLAQASCVGSDTMQTCMDSSGNNYTVTRMGNTTQVHGSNASTGNSWNQTSSTMGNTTITNGTAADGSSWNSTSTTLGGGFRSVHGTDSHGNSFSYTCNRFGCN